MSVGLTYSLYENVDDRTKRAVIETRWVGHLLGWVGRLLGRLADALAGWGWLTDAINGPTYRRVGRDPKDTLCMKAVQVDCKTALETWQINLHKQDFKPLKSSIRIIYSFCV